MFPELKIGDLVAKTPIVQGGMGVGISLSGLASAVAEQGGIGIIASVMVGMNEPDISKKPIEANLRALRNEIAKAREKTKGIIGVNIMVALTTFKEMASTAIKSRADIIFSGAGLPLDLPRILLDTCEEKKEQFKTKLVPIVSSARAAGVIAKRWMTRYSYAPDALVLEGPNAGGHLGFKAEELYDSNFSLENLLPLVLDEAKKIEDQSGKQVPVIVGGGVYTGADIAKFLDLGASGVQMGTRFVATEECDADVRFKEAFISATSDDIAIIKSPVGMPGRALKSQFIHDMEDGKTKPFKCSFHCIHTCDPKTTPYCIALALISSVEGELDKGFAFCGANVGKVDKIISVKELFETLQAEYNVARQQMIK